MSRLHTLVPERPATMVTVPRMVAGRQKRSSEPSKDAEIICLPASAAQVDVHDVGGTGVFDYFVSLGAAVEVVKEAFALAEQDRHDGQMEIVDESGAQVLLDR